MNSIIMCQIKLRGVILSRGKGEGSITKRKDGRYMARITFGRKADGKPKIKTFYAKTSKECQDKLNNFKYESEKGIYIESNSITLGEWLDYYYENHVINSVKPSTRVSYEMIIRQHLKPNLGGYKLKELKASTIQSFYNKLLNSGRADNKGGLSEKTIRNIHLVLRKALQIAVDDDKIAKNPAVGSKISLPKKQEKESIKVLTKEEQKLLEKECEKHRLGKAIILDLYSGMRQGELLALTWTDIDFENNTITINKQLQRLKNFDENIPESTSLHINRYTKTSSGRVISTSPKIMEMLKNYKMEENKYKQMLGEAYRNKNLVFCKEDGNFIEPSTFQKFFKKCLKSAGIKQLNVHSMRHTFATRMLETKKVPIKVVSEILGHATIQITLDTYSHVLPNLQAEAMQIITDYCLEQV